MFHLFFSTFLFQCLLDSLSSSRCPPPLSSESVSPLDRWSESTQTEGITTKRAPSCLFNVLSSILELKGQSKRERERVENKSQQRTATWMLESFSFFFSLSSLMCTHGIRRWGCERRGEKFGSMTEPSLCGAKVWLAGRSCPVSDDIGSLHPLSIIFNVYLSIIRLKLRIFLELLKLSFKKIMLSCLFYCDEEGEKISAFCVGNLLSIMTGHCDREFLKDMAGDHFIYFYKTFCACLHGITNKLDKSLSLLLP